MKNLKKLRQQNGMSQEKLAQQFHITQQAVYKYESGISQPDIERLMEFADFFQTSVDYLIGYTDDPRPHEKMIPTHLNANEMSVIEAYRHLPLDIRPHILAILEGFNGLIQNSQRQSE